MCLLYFRNTFGCSYTGYVATVTSYTAYYAKYTSCGWWGRRRCRDGLVINSLVLIYIIYSTGSNTAYRTTMVAKKYCCSGYGPLPNCPRELL